jgi:ring-1,2-phenylacetyl-CoA epoxidase subunit PaaD
MISAEQSIQNIYAILEEVKDPEVPVLTVNDLGIIRKVEIVAVKNEQPAFEITITPTYSGCPAMDAIATNIRMALYAHGITNFSINQVLSPAWTTAWMSERGKQKLVEYGIAAPNALFEKFSDKIIGDKGPAACPLCSSTNTSIISEFGSTACKSLYKCNDCLEPFDYFKCH